MDRRWAPALAFRIGNRVWFNAQNITTQRPSQKLDYRRIGPYGITKVVSPYTYEIDFPATVKNHRFQHVSLFDPADNDLLPDQHNPPPLPVIVDNVEEWHVEEILDLCIHYQHLQNLVNWVGYDRPDWEPAEGMNKLEAVDHFNERYPQKPGPLAEDDEG